MKELITMEQYVINNASHTEFTYKELIMEFYNYAKLLQSKSTLSMFVACDDEGNVLEDISKKLYPASMSYAKLIDEEKQQYQQALEKVIFDGWSVYENNNETIAIEDLEGNNLFFMKTNSSILFYSKNSNLFPVTSKYWLLNLISFLIFSLFSTKISKYLLTAKLF